jgi:hypothetical protein
MDGLTKLPPGVRLGPLSARVFAVLEKHTAFPWPVLVAQCKRHGVDPADLDAAALEGLIPMLARGVERFTSPQHGEEVFRELETLMRELC